MTTKRPTKATSPVEADLDGDQLDQAAEAEPDANLPARLVLATGRIVAAENTNTTHHYDEQAGVTVPVVSSYLLPTE